MAIVLLVVWFVGAFSLSYSHTLDEIPSAVLFTAGIAAAVGYFGLYLSFRRLRHYVLSRSLRSLTLVEVSRFVGVMAVIKYMEGVLPARFAIPTAISDVTIALTAFPVAFWLVSASGSFKPGFVLWHYLGLLGLIVSGALGIVTSPTPLGVLSSYPTSQAMSSFPLNLVPLFLGPLTLIVHLMALTNAYHRMRSATGRKRQLTMT